MAKSITDLQSEREQLNAAQAKTDFEQALKSTCDKSALVKAASATRALLLDLMSKLPTLLLDAIATEASETQVHYLLSDAAHSALSQFNNQVDAASAVLPQFGESFKRGCKPRDILTVSQWADKHRWIKSGTNAPGKWQTNLTPYLREIMDSLSEHSPVREVVFMKSSGVGGTEAMYNWLGYTMHHLQNKDMLVVSATLELRDRSFNPRLNKMLAETKVLSEMISNSSRNKSNRADLMEYGGMTRLIKAGANSADSLRSDHLPYVICDEVDAFKWDIDGEGDPLTLIENRQRTFSRAKTFLISTPTKENNSRISKKYEITDKRRYFVHCPHCNELQILEKGDRETPHGLKWRKSLANPAVVDMAWYLCKYCACIIEEAKKSEMLHEGIWVPEKPEVQLIRGYHSNALYAAVGLGLGWKQIAEKWLSCQNDSSELKAFVNTYLGEVFKEEGTDIQNISLISRLEEYDNPPILAITAYVDVQKDRLEATIDGWGLDEECWTLDHIIVPGDTAQQEVWDEMHDALLEAKVEFCGVDSGYQTSMVYAFCEKRKWTVATKGVSGMGRPLIEDERKRRQRLRVKRKKGAPVEPLGVDQGKALIYSRLKTMQPGAGYIHFPKTAAFDEEYFAQLAAERLVTKVRGTRPIQEWVQLRPRNEALDCKVGSLATFRLAKFDMQARAAKKAQKQNKEEENENDLIPIASSRRRVRVRQV
jgi:phage terminase large subunit GpA-like protein